MYNESESIVNLTSYSGKPYFVVVKEFEEKDDEKVPVEIGIFPVSKTFCSDERHWRRKNKVEIYELTEKEIFKVLMDHIKETKQ